ncbi:37S ribosomal protein S22 [Umbelopsis nana]
MHRLIRTQACRKSFSTFQGAMRKQKAIFIDDLEALSNSESSLTERNLEEIDIPDTDLEGPELRGSMEASFGRKRIGCVQLPASLKTAIQDTIAEADKPLVRTDALRIYESFRSTSKLPAVEQTSTRKSDKRSKKELVIEGHIMTYGEREAIAYVAGALPATYAAIFNVLKELKERICNFEPKSMLDFGTGPGTGIWAAREHFELEKCTGVDISEDMLRMAEDLIEKSGKKDYAHNTTFQRYFSYNPKQPRTDLVLSAFTLGDTPSEALRRSALQSLWDQTGDVLVLIERGTPVGFRIIAQAREWILETNSDHQQQIAHVVAPCPHDKPCPMFRGEPLNPDRDWCHFSQRVERPRFLMRTKHSKVNVEDAKYSYVILRKGARPTVTSSEQEDLETEAYDWPRIITPPLKKNKHVVMDVCAPSGEIQRMIIPKSQGKIPYRDARKSAWGDLFPHTPKNTAVVRIKQKSLQQESTDVDH